LYNYQTHGDKKDQATYGQKVLNSSQRKAAQHLKRDGVFNDNPVTNALTSLRFPVNAFRKSVSIWQSNRQQLLFLDSMRLIVWGSFRAIQ